jgi:O-antigen ligase
MKLELYGTRIDPKRAVLFVAAPLACCVIAAAWFFPAAFSAVLMLLVFLPAIALCIDRPAIVFYIFVLVLFSNLDIYSPFPIYRYIVIFIVAALALAFANGRRLVAHHPILIALAAAFAIIAFQSLSVAHDDRVATRDLLYFFKVLVAVAIVVQFTRDRGELRRFLLVLAGGMLLADFLPFIVHPPARYGSLSMIWGQGIVRYEGFVFEPNTFALFQLFLIPVLVFFAAAYRRPRIARPFFALAVLGSIAVLVLSFSRGGFVGLAALLVSLIIVERKNRPLFLFGVAIIAASVVLVPGVYWQRIGSVFDFATRRAGDYAIYTRIETMKVALRLGLAHPLLGVGIGNFIPSSAHFIPHGLTVHNSPLQVISELGFVAFALFAAIVVYNFRIIRRMTRNESDPEIAQMGRALFVQHVAMLASSLFLPVFYDIIMWLMLAMPAVAEHAYLSESGEAGAVSSASMGRK